MRKLAFVVLIFILAACSTKKQELKTGAWLGVIKMDSTSEKLDVPFNFDVVNEGGRIALQVKNADEKIYIDEVQLKGDTLLAKFPTFTSELQAIVGDSLKGYYYPKGEVAGVRYRFYALKGEKDRFPWFTGKPVFNISGRWWFIEDPGKPDSMVNVAELKQDGAKVVGTILNPYGDYRYLEGKVAGNMFFFSKNDGAQTIIIRGEIADSNSMVNGIISGSPRWISSWKAIRDDNAKLPEPESLVHVRKGYSTFKFEGIDVNGNKVTSLD